MNVQIVTRHLDPGKGAARGLTEHIRQVCLEFGERCADAQDIQVVLEDINGPTKGGVDKHCHIKVRGRERLHLDASATRPELWQAADAAFRRLDRLFVRRERARRPSTEGEGTYALPEPTEAASLSRLAIARDEGNPWG